MKRRSMKRSFFKKKPTQYHYIQDFENTTEKICRKYDKDNDGIYVRNSQLYTKTKRLLEKNSAIFKIEGPPDPPRVPSNYELFVIHQNRNSLTNNKIQTMAILYLLKNGYKLVIDPEVEFIPKVMKKENKLFEPYMAIDIASSINSNFTEDITKNYRFQDDVLDNSELSIEEKIDKFNQHRMIRYFSSSNHANETVVDNTNYIEENEAPPRVLKNNVLSPVPSAPPQEDNMPMCVSGIYPSLKNETEPPAYSSDTLLNSNSEEGRINIFINK